MKKIVLFSSLFVLIDQIIKLVVKNLLLYNVEKTIISNFFYLTYVKNTGGAFSILENNQILLALIGIIAIIFLFYYLNKKKDLTNLELISYSLLIGGIIGNIIDRIVLNSVVDYIGFIFFGYYYPVFNLADTFIVVSIIILLFIEFRGVKNGNSCQK